MVHEVIVGQFHERKESRRFVDERELEALRRQLARGEISYVLDRDANRPEADWWLNAPGEDGAYGHVYLEDGDALALERLPTGARDHVVRAVDARP